MRRTWIARGRAFWIRSRRGIMKKEKKEQRRNSRWTLRRKTSLLCSRNLKSFITKNNDFSKKNPYSRMKKRKWWGTWDFIPKSPEVVASIRSWLLKHFQKRRLWKEILKQKTPKDAVITPKEPVVKSFIPPSESVNATSNRDDIFHEEPSSRLGRRQGMYGFGDEEDVKGMVTQLLSGAVLIPCPSKRGLAFLNQSVSGIWTLPHASSWIEKKCHTKKAKMVSDWKDAWNYRHIHFIRKSSKGLGSRCGEIRKDKSLHLIDLPQPSWNRTTSDKLFRITGWSKNLQSLTLFLFKRSSDPNGAEKSRREAAEQWTLSKDLLSNTICRIENNVFPWSALQSALSSTFICPFFEDLLEKLYWVYDTAFEELLEIQPSISKISLIYVYDLLCSKPEGEANLCALLVNKLVPSATLSWLYLLTWLYRRSRKKLASKASYCLSQL
jgi:hypothetical protein